MTEITLIDDLDLGQDEALDAVDARAVCMVCMVCR